MRVDELRAELDQLAGPPLPSPAGGLREVRRTVRRRRLLNGAFAACAVAVVVVGILVVTRGDAARVSPSDSSPTTTMPPPPSVDPRTMFDQPRVGVVDHNGRTRGTIPTAAYKAAMGIKPDGSLQPRLRDNSPVPVLTDEGRTDGYWLPCYGFVERAVVEVPHFDPDEYCAEQNAKDDTEWWGSLTPEQQQELMQKGVRPPSTTTAETP
jgi:hypothetical protein